MTFLAVFTAFKALPWKLIGILLAIGALLFAGYHLEHQASLIAQLTADRDKAVQAANLNAAALKATEEKHEEIVISAEKQIQAEKDRQADLQTTIESLKNATSSPNCQLDPAARSALQRLR